MRIYGKFFKADCMTEDGIKLTPLAGRVTLNKKEAITGSVFVAILINIFTAVLVQAANLLFLQSLPALFWCLAAVLISADAALCVYAFRRSISDVTQSCSAAPYTIAYRHDGFVVLCHKSGEREYIPAASVKDVKAYPAKLGFIINGWAYSGNLNYGRVVFFLDCGGEKAEKRTVKYVVNCVQAARYIRDVYLPQSGTLPEGGGEGCGRSENGGGNCAY